MVLLLSVLTVIIYWPSFNAPFVFDDDHYIVRNYRIFSLSRFWPPSGSRYVALLSFALNYFFGGLKPFGYHLVNAAIHVINSALVYLLVALTFKTDRMEGFNERTDKTAAFYIAVASSVLFAVHPVQTGAITYITQRFTSLTTLFYLLSLVGYLTWRLSAKGSGVLRPGVYMLSLASAVAAQKTKEIAFTLPAIILFFEFVFFHGGAYGRKVLRLAPFLLVMLIIPLTLLLPGHAGDMAEVAEKTMAAEVKDLTTLSRHDYLVTQFRVIATYLRLLVWPVNQNLDYDYPMFKSIFVPEVFLSLLLILALFCFGVFVFIRSFKKKDPLLLLAGAGIFWFFTTISIESSVIPIRDVIFEHRLYLPSPGIAITFNSLLFYALSGLQGRIAFKASTAAFVILFFAGTALSTAAFRRNLVWTSEIALWQDTVEKSPAKARPHNNLANAYAEASRINDAIREYREAIRIDPKDLHAHNNLGTVYKDAGRMDEAVVEFKKAVAINPAYPFAHNNLGAAYFSKGDVLGAIDEYEESIRLEPGNVEAYYNLGAAFDAAGRREDAIEAYQAFVDLAPPRYFMEIERMRARITELKATGKNPSGRQGR